jgi:hypothetical protein
MGLKSDDTEWYRSSSWDASVAGEFEVKLDRARRFNRPQYVHSRREASHDGPSRAEANLQHGLAHRQNWC